MIKINDKAIKSYIKEHTEELFELHKALCLIPAPSHMEDARAAFCKAWFDQNCGEGAYIDEAKNVILPYRAKSSDSAQTSIAMSSAPATRMTKNTAKYCATVMPPDTSANICMDTRGAFIAGRS